MPSVVDPCFWALGSICAPGHQHVSFWSGASSREDLNYGPTPGTMDKISMQIS